MAYLLQLRILLWKNFTLKKRSPFVLMFELFIPLVLFVILLAIRRKQPAYPVSPNRFHAQPLPSAGVMAILQAFCRGGHKDEQGVLNYPNSTVFEFLENFNSIAQHNNFFDPGFSPEEMEHIPELYQSIIEDPAALHDKFKQAHDFQIFTIFRNVTWLEGVLSDNFSLPLNELQAVFNAKVNMSEVYQVLRNHDDWQAEEGTVRVLSSLLGFGDLTGDLDPVLVVKVLKKLILSPYALHYIACDHNELASVLIPQQPEDEDKLVMLSEEMCNLTMDQWKVLSLRLQESVSTEAVIQLLDLNHLNLTTARIKVSEFIANLTEFWTFEYNLLNLSKFATQLPQNACKSETPGNMTDHVTNTTEPGVTEQPDDTTHTPHIDGGERKEKKKKHNKYSGLLQIWTAMQSTICGQPAITKDKLDKSSDSGGLGDLGLTKKQQYDIGILVHVLYSNPKVLYAPNNTAADLVIKQANQSFVLVDRISEYATKWLNVSAQLRHYLMLNSTVKNLESIREMQHELRGLPLLRHILDNPRVNQFVDNLTTPSQTFFLHQLDVVDNAACSWLELLKGISLNVFQGFGTEEELVDYVLHKAYFDNVTVFASVVFSNIKANASLPPHVIYKIRQNASFTQNTKFVRPQYWYPGPKAWGYNYYQFGFAWIQDIIERAIINIHAGREVVEPGGYLHQFPYPCFMSDQFLFMIEHVMPLCLTISWVYTVAMLVQSIVYEKEQGLKEVMKIMGLNNSVHWLAWFITSFVQMSFTMGVLTAMLKYGNVLTYSNSAIIFIVLEVFAIATISFSFFISVLYSKAKLAAACAGIVYFLSYVPYMYVAIREEAAGDHITAWAKSMASLLSTTAFGLGAKYFAYYEIEGVGVQWNNIYISPVEDDQYNLLYVCVMMIIDALLYGLLTWYIENVHPGSYGLPKPWYFPLTRTYWCGTSSRGDTDQCGWSDCFTNRHGLSVTEEDQACAMDHDDDHHNNFECEPVHLPLGVTVENLTKVYKTGKLAVNKLSLNLYEGQITSFLGHNGAGKTTTMSILTGLIPPSGGYATVYGCDIRSDMEEIRKSLGMCPQHNVLFDKLTVEEHLWFYARLKGMPTKDIQQEMESMIQDIGLPKKRNSTVDCLSGGMQRKLSVAIAFVAGSRTVILDEPTAGVDPYARRAIWDLLIKYKTGRTILLSTHHMDEADILGDRIAIISNGQLKCCGSPLFLKSTFGDGYHLRLVKNTTESESLSRDSVPEDGDSLQSSFSSKCSASAVTSFITEHISTAYVKANTSQEIHYILPFEEARKGNFHKLFQKTRRRRQ
eukprot:GHVU01125596.1.p1 GENE.GHVU01125596.1~~GHVU01125596.1.p1  ORF type:complete len:1296 (-),score=180.93 GHVU01125596.1:585-4472(-)